MPIWPLFERAYTLVRRAPLSGKELYQYRLLAREARYEHDYEAIVDIPHSSSNTAVAALCMLGSWLTRRSSPSRSRSPRSQASRRGCTWTSLPGRGASGHGPAYAPPRKEHAEQLFSVLERISPIGLAELGELLLLQAGGLTQR